MHAETLVVPAEPSRPSLLTVASIGAIACVAADMVHEALGHGTASWLAGDRILSLSTVAIQNASASRFVSAAGTSASYIVGALSFLALRRIRWFTPWAFLLWAFGAYNLLNSGYLVVSAVLNSGDWANVITGLSPPWLWRCGLGLAGATLYFWLCARIRKKSQFSGFLNGAERLPRQAGLQKRLKIKGFAMEMPLRVRNYESLKTRPRSLETRTGRGFPHSHSNCHYWRPISENAESRQNRSLFQIPAQNRIS